MKGECAARVQSGSPCIANDVGFWLVSAGLIDAPISRSVRLQTIVHFVPTRAMACWQRQA
jgi:hypothetical protein